MCPPCKSLFWQNRLSKKCSFLVALQKPNQIELSVVPSYTFRMLALCRKRRLFHIDFLHTFRCFVFAGALAHFLFWICDFYCKFPHVMSIVICCMWRTWGAVRLILIDLIILLIFHRSNDLFKNISAMPRMVPKPVYNFKANVLKPFTKRPSSEGKDVTLRSLCRLANECGEHRDFRKMWVEDGRTRLGG